MLAAVMSSMLLLAGATQVPPQDIAPVDFDTDVRPILADRCFACHGPDAAERKAGLRLDRRDAHAAIVPGAPDASALVERVFAADPDERMPPAGSGLSLSEREKVTLRRWIAEGAPFGQHWAFVPPTRPPVPAGARHPIDAFVRARLAGTSLEPTPEATRPALIRRVTFDLTGLPPTLTEVDAFLADRAPDAYERLVDRLLARPSYGEHMARPWLDAARYADTNGYQGDGVRTMWPWRDQVIDALNANVPFDQFTIAQLAGDLLPDPTTADVVATGFHRNHMLNGEGGRIAEESRVEYVIDRVNTTGTVWLGLTLGCAQCHDHKFDPIAQRDYYRFYAYFNSIDESGAVDAGGNARPVLKVPTAEQREILAALEREAARLTAAAAASVRFDADAFVGWLQSAGRNAPWTPLTPTCVTTSEPVTVTPLGDGSTLIGGGNPENNDYLVFAALDAGRITGLRLDALTDPSFTNGYLARSNSGNFVLTGIEVELMPRGGAPRPLAIQDAAADFSQGRFDVRKTYDGNPQTGWAVDGDESFAPHHAVFRFAEPVTVEAGATLAVRLEHRSRNKFHNLGRFRLSIAGDPEPALDAEVGLPAAARAALLRSPADRTAAEWATLLDCFGATQKPDPAVTAELAEVRTRVAAVQRSVVATMVMRERAEPRTTHLLRRGQYDQPDRREALTPGVPPALCATPDDLPDRLELARWLVSPDCPLTARVTVNRAWQQFFGTGIVKTAEDFGVQGDPPTHPALLDWLATEFVASGWDLKALHRLIVTSATYRQSAHADAASLERDPQNRLLARGPRRRLSSYAIRDQALALSGLLVDRVGGPPVKPYQPDGVWAEATFGTIRFVQDHGESLYRRSLYTFWRRIVGPTGLFDAASRQLCEVRREATNTPLHALVTLNDPTFVEAARVLATRLQHACRTPDERVARVFRMATARVPTDAERRELMKAWAGFRAAFADDPAAARELASVGEWPTDPTIDAVELAALTQLCHLVLNLDEVLSTS